MPESPGPAFGDRKLLRPLWGQTDGERDVARSVRKDVPLYGRLASWMASPYVCLCLRRREQMKIYATCAWWCGFYYTETVSQPPDQIQCCRGLLTDGPAAAMKCTVDRCAPLGCTGQHAVQYSSTLRVVFCFTLCCFSLFGFGYQNLQHQHCLAHLQT